MTETAALLIPTAPPPPASAAPVLTGAAVTLVILLSVTVNIVSHMHRTAPAVVTPEILSQLALDPATMALITGSYMAAAMLCQVPAGVLFDHYGVTRTIPVLMLLGAAGAALFGATGSAFGLAAGRALSGIGCGALIMGSMVICSQIVPRARFAAMVGVILATGQIGNILVTAPLAYLSERIGWNNAFLGLSVLTLSTAAAYFLVLYRQPLTQPRSKETLGQSLRGTGRIFGNRRLWPVFAVALTGYSTHFTLMVLWYGLYLDKLGLDLWGRGKLLFLVSIAFTLGLFLFGKLQLWVRSIKATVLIGAAMTVFMLLVLCLLRTPTLVQVTAIFIVIGLSGGFTGSIIAHGCMFYRHTEFGRGVTAMNTLVLGGATASQFWSGPLFNLAERWLPDGDLTGFRVVFLALALWLGLGMLIYLRSEAAPEAPK